MWSFDCDGGARSLVTDGQNDAVEVAKEQASQGADGDDDLLAHPTRVAIVEKLGEMPGLNKNQLRQELDVGLKVLDHHVTRLVDAGIVVRRPSAQGKEHLYFNADDQDLWENPRTRIMFGREATRNVGLYLVEHPGASSKEVAEALDITPMTVRHHLRTLKEHEIVTSASVGRRVEYHPLRELRRWAAELGERYERPWE